MKKTFFIFISCISSYTFSQSAILNGSTASNQLNTITTAVPFLEITPDARAGAMGDAVCASTPTVVSNYWNASAYGFIKNKNGISVSYTPWLRALVPDINLLDAALYKRMGKKNVIGLSGRYFSLGNIA